MKKFNFLFLMLLSVVFVACDDDEAVLDTQDPTITITSPTSQAEVNPDNPVTVTATVRDNLGLDAVTISVTPPGGTAQVVHTENVRDFLNDNTEADIDEEVNLGTSTPGPGAYTITVTATDTRGNEASQSVTVNVGEADPNAPTVTISAPVNNAEFMTGQDIIVTANVAEDRMLSEVIIDLRPNATNANPVYQDTISTFESNTAYDIQDTISLPIDAPVGAYTLTIWATDEYGNRQEETASLSVSQGTNTGDENSVSISGIEEGQTYQNIGTETPVTFDVSDTEGADSVNVSLQSEDGVALMSQGYNQAYFDENQVENSTAFNFQDNLYVPNVAAARGQNTLTVTTYRDNNGTWEETGTEAVNFNAEPQTGAREVNVTTTAPTGFEEDSRVFLAGNFQGAEVYGNDYDPAYELTRNDDGTYGTTIYANENQDFTYRYSTMDAAGNQSVEVDANCQQVMNYPRAYTYANGANTVNEQVNFSGYGACVD